MPLKQIKQTKPNVAQSAGAAEYTDYTSTQGQNLCLTSVLNITLNNLMVRFQ